ncbi:3'-5' exoribonuclease HELZ2-like isoform X2 [Antennarius striatus]|uniref:3'-5' exoribonuclease HELZ2-like isoform X2 n=1 Tax=Antennarius striatus TaxID=241820 RepID=UPI0035B4BC68
MIGGEKEMSHSADAQALTSYNDRLLEEFRNSSNDNHILSEEIDDVGVSCDKDLTVSCDQTDVTLQWNFQVKTERQLVHVALLKQEPGASFTFGEVGSVACIYSSGEFFLMEDITYEVTVSFTAVNPGLYEQWLVLDFDTRPVLLRKIKVRVGQQTVEDYTDTPVDYGVAFRSAEHWHQWNRVIITCLSRTDDEVEMLNKYKPPQLRFLSRLHNHQISLNHDNYKERMHDFLYREERAKDQVISRLTVRGEITTLKILTSLEFGMAIAPEGQLFCAVYIPYNLTPDTPEGLVLKRSVQSVLIAPLSSNDPNSKVYEAIILHVNARENKMYLKLSKICCCDLALKSDQSYQMEVQFQVNRYNFCIMHKAVDLLPDTKRVLPDLKNCGVPVTSILCEKLNKKQHSALEFITGKADKFVAPLLIYGPFGTGKTFTLATAARKLCEHPGNKVLVCTHTNSSADLYIREHFHPFMDKINNRMKPIRIKANKANALSATDDITIKYCFLADNGQTFLPPTEAALDSHNIVITTTAMAIYFYDLKLPENYFTHVLIDEASQMLECEALMAVGLAGPNTKVVLAGDHMQMGPKLFSIGDRNRSHCTLFNRLFHLYQGQKCDTAQSSRVIFNENYRSTNEIVEFVSTHFYQGKNIIKATADIPPPTNGHALKFHHVRGECLFDTVSMSWFNKEEIAIVVEEVKEILEHWPSSWGINNESTVCVLSDGSQVRQIRTVLKRRGLGEVYVENIANVQGKQFRVVILTAVHTGNSLKTSHLPGLELFNDSRVLNTAMTRAQSLVVVVGDAAALCCFGKCSGVWKSYIDHCINNSSVAPHHFTQDFFERDVMETARFQKSEQSDESNTQSDAILQELKDEYKQLEMDYSLDEEEVEFDKVDQHNSGSSYNVRDVDFLELCKELPNIYKSGKLFRQSHNRGYVRLFQDPTKHIHIKGKANLHNVFTGDEVVLEKRRVVSITKEDESARLLVCTLQDEDHSKPRQNSNKKFVTRTMIPINRTEPKVVIVLSKQRRNFLPIWEQIDEQWFIVSYERLNENLKQDNVFLVKVIAWKKWFNLPQGNVIDILPVGGSLDEGLTILNEELKIEPNIWSSVKDFSVEDEHKTYRKDLCGIITFTVDPESCSGQTHRDLDDAISVRETGAYYELGVHIADVASFVTPGCALDVVAKERGISHYCSGGEAIHMFPKDNSRHFSLLQGKERRVISLMFKVNKQTHKIDGKPKFQLSLINSNKQLSYEEAEKMISNRCERNQRFDTVDDCVRVAYCFAKAQRKLRLKDWAYAQTDDDRLPGKRKANLMIEELNMLFNQLASEVLIGSEDTKYCTPLRCQEEPYPEKIQEFLKKKCAAFIPLSFHLRHRVLHDRQSLNCLTFRALVEVWKDIQAAARTDDVDKMVDLIAADDIHPLLQPVINEFKKCSSKAYIICSNSSHRAGVGHYSLSVKSYTQASSPIRRYMDIVLQRLLHSVICNKHTQYTATEITDLCNYFESNIKCAKAREQKAEQISYAVSMSKQSASKIAFVVSADPNTESFAVSFPFNKNIFEQSLEIMYRDLQLWDQPLYDEENHCITLTWKRVIYSSASMQRELKMPFSGPCVDLPLTIWEAAIEAIEEEDFDQAKRLILSINTDQMGEQNNQMPLPETNTCVSVEVQTPKVQNDHEVDINMQLQAGDTLRVQLTSEIKRGYNMPTIQLVRIKPHFEICVDHVHRPIYCFSRSTDDPSRNHYSNPQEYVRIWKPLCEMESAATAVDEGDSVIIEDLEIDFIQEKEDTLTGSFFLSKAWIDDMDFEWNLLRCLLCIRKRGLLLPTPLKHSAAVDPKDFTWVAHAVSRKVEERKNPENSGIEVEFYVNHLPMETIPDCVFQKKTLFTVEIIPKLIPDIRKEDAVTNVLTACHLVTAVAVGQHIPKEVNATWYNISRTLPTRLPTLNDSQRLAVVRALNSTFTLIQGPPGTGKTIVGVYIVKHFFELNSKSPRKFVHLKDKNKKEVILYCGPSNKSVDVVAEFLLKFGDELKLLRVYSQQVEMLDYPYPVSTLQFSSLRHERAKPELRGITLHHRMREDQNPYSHEIKQFDQRMQRALEQKIIPAEEIKEYKALLRAARTHEFEHHDVILCTCTQASTPGLNKVVSARQILIDECGMATEPQALIPLVCNNPEKIVLIGDHKQLRPIVKNPRVRMLGMARSLFERCHTMHEKRTVMLNTQYRMHVDICKFPSSQFYEGKLKTGVEQPQSVLCVEKRRMPIVFGDIEGTTVSLVVSTARGNERSKANEQERQKAIDVAEKLVKAAKVEQRSIAILSPYNAQVAEIKDDLRNKKMEEITVATITKSQVN